MLFRKFVKRLAFVASKARLILSLNNANRPKSAIASYIGVVNHLWIGHTIGAVMETDDKEIWKFKQSALTSWCFSKKVSYMALWCGGVYKD